MSVIDWDFGFAHLHVNDMSFRFLQFLTQLIEVYVHLKTLDRPTSLPWPVNPPPPRKLKHQRSYQCSLYKSQHATHVRGQLWQSLRWNIFLIVIPNTDVSHYKL